MKGGRSRAWLGALIVTAAAALAAAAGAAESGAFWTLALADSVTLPGPLVRLADVAASPVPDGLRDMVLIGDGRPGTARLLERRLVLRRLVEMGRAAEVRLCAGAEACRVRFASGSLDAGPVRDRVAALLGPWLPAAPAGAPPPWLEVTLPPTDLPGGDWTVELTDPKTLAAGRNLVRVRIAAGGRAARVTASVVCHAYGEAARARQAVGADAALAPEQFLWDWVDLAEESTGLAVGRECLAGRSAGRAIAVGERLRLADLRATPVVRQGEPVELSLGRGAVQVTVRATARQDGTLGQVITVRNELSGHLIAARVTGPGRVAWGR